MLQYLDFSNASTSRKWGHKRQGDGLEAPRNSMEFALEASHSYGVFQEDVPYSCNMRQYPKSGLSHSSNPVKKLIQEDISFRTNEGQKRPGVIARLMGMESPPLNATTESISRSEITPRSLPRRDNPSEMISAKHVSFVQHNNRDSTKQAPKQEIRAYGYGDERDVFGQMNKRSNEWSKPQPREHPQEEELQKFKKEFEAWQASRAWEQSTSFELESSFDDDDDDDSRCTDIVPYRYQHHQNGKAASHGSKHMHTSNEDVHWRRSSKESSTSISGSRTFSLTTSADAAAACSTRLPFSRFYHEEERSSLSPTRIVILKPCPELSTDDIEESSLGSPELVKKENNMEAFLEEVKKRLKIELEGGVASDEKQADRRWSAAAGDIIPADPKQIARSIANQIRENVTRDMHPALVRSESTRSYRSDLPFDGQGQMDYIGRDARRQLSDRLKNVLRRDTPDAETPFSFSHRRRATSTSFDEEPRPKPTRHEVAPPPPPRKGKVRSKEEKKRAVESDIRSFRYGSNNTPTTTTQPDSEPVSPRNLMRSFSAPVSGTTFVKLLSEEPRVLTGARLQRKQEGHGSSRPASSEERKGRKDAFSIRGKVSNLRQNLGLRAKLFGKKFHASDEPFPDDLPPFGTLVTAPSVLIHPGVLQENSTEVPPSPASWCSSPPDEMNRGGYPSPVSPLEASFSEHRSHLRTEAKDMASTASEPGIMSEQVQAEEERAETSPVLDEQEQDDGDMDATDGHPIKSFVRAVLVIAGMYGRRQNPGNAAMSDCEAKPIPKWVLEEVVSSSSSAPVDDGAAAVDHRLLFDLVNEALPGAVRASTTLCAFDKCYAMAPRRTPGGKTLLEALWKSMQVWLEPPSDSRTASSASVDVLIGRDLSVSPWHGAFREDADALARDVEAEMLDELLDETVWDVLLNVGD
ncbi:uncharacterized protein LOC8085683 isoform X2 [Sorghum bicolor]|uniref:DUF4378 domain-containing protein n=1 Tax=Sorghum bicolor TaxID=4558 RepID=C5WZV8_SORBI|nr:uncharacterized protein LOC8085683 isoform X2 [Sorghum bicolor]EER95573.2 hypothetical protein SORBI_3001G518300 [Sorghum bicolor]|eukprot:XP_021307093.1 uncharacterized protein LOC8085683 isoform X2 [Sorghum bicolor]